MIATINVERKIILPTNHSAYFVLVVALLALTGCKSAPKDFVSGYDFKNARLVDLPWEMGAVIIGCGSHFDYEAYVREHHPNWNYVQHHFGYSRFTDLNYVPNDSTNYVYIVDDPASIIPKYDRVEDNCRLQDGALLHDLCVSNGVVTMESDQSYFMESDQSYFTPLQVYVVEYKDFNNDGYTDVEVQRALPGSARPYESLVLSRKQPTGMFHVVEHVSGGIRVDAGESWTWKRDADGTRKRQIHIHVDDGMTIADLARQYEVSEEIIRSANGLGEDDKIQDGSWVVVPDRE